MSPSFLTPVCLFISTLYHNISPRSRGISSGLLLLSPQGQQTASHTGSLCTYCTQEVGIKGGKPILLTTQVSPTERGRKPWVVVWLAYLSDPRQVSHLSLYGPQCLTGQTDKPCDLSAVIVTVRNLENRGTSMYFEEKTDQGQDKLAYPWSLYISS